MFRRLLRAYGRHMARAWAMWPELFWLNMLIAFTNAMTAIVIIRSSPDVAGILTPPVLLSAAILFLGLVAGLLHNRNERQKARRQPFYDTPIPEQREGSDG